MYELVHVWRKSTFQVFYNQNLLSVLALSGICWRQILSQGLEGGSRSLFWLSRSKLCLALLLQQGLFATSSNRESSSPTFIPSRLGCICWEEVSFSCLWSDPTMRMFQNKKTQNNSIMKTRSLLLKCIKATIRASFSWQLVDKTRTY